jgi:hypothetical protein
MPAAPWVAFPRGQARSLCSRERLGSRRSACAPPCVPAASATPSTRPGGGGVAGRGAGGESPPTGAGLGAGARALLCLLRPPPPAPRRFAVVPRPAFRAPGMEVAPEKHAHGNGPPSALPAAPAPGASGCGATFPRPLALSAVAVRRLTVGRAGVRSAGGHPPAVAFGSYLPHAAQAQTAVHVQGTFTPGARAHAGRTPDTAADGRDSGGANVVGTDAGGGWFCRPPLSFCVRQLGR